MKNDCKMQISEAEMKRSLINFMVTPCIKWCRTLFIYQLTHTTLKA